MSIVLAVPRPKPHAAQVSFQSRSTRRMNNYHKRWICAPGRVENLEPHLCLQLDLLTAELLGFRQAFKQQAGCSRDVRKCSALIVTWCAAVEYFCERDVLPRADDAGPVCRSSTGIEESQSNHGSGGQGEPSADARTANCEPRAAIKALQSTSARLPFPSERRVPPCCHRRRGSRRRAFPCGCPDAASPVCAARPGPAGSACGTQAGRD